MEILIRKAKASDVDAIFILVNFYAKRGKLLRRSRADIRKNIRDFFVAVKAGDLVGCASLDVYSRKMAEMRSLAVKPSQTNSGIGGELVNACLARAKKKQILEVMVISSEENFFKKCGFNYTLPGQRKALFINP